MEVEKHLFCYVESEERRGKVIVLFDDLDLVFRVAALVRLPHIQSPPAHSLPHLSPLIFESYSLNLLITFLTSSDALAGEKLSPAWRACMVNCFADSPPWHNMWRRPDLFSERATSALSETTLIL
jgi:hypothetical protein